MGCKESTERDDGSEINPPDKPKVPLQCWYASPFDEPASMEFTALHKAKKGKVIFSHSQIPTTQAELDSIGNSLQLVESSSPVKVGQDHLYGLGYLHESALNIEHCWRLRVAHNAVSGMQRFDRPFYDMLIGVKLFVNDISIPDSCPHPESMPQCTTTYRAHEGTTQWRAVPVMLWPAPDSPFNEGSIYPPLTHSFLSAVSTLDPGLHDLRVEIVYGCKSEGEFCTDFIARGSCRLDMTPAAQTKAINTLAIIEPMAKATNPGVVRPIVNTQDFTLCRGCNRAQKYACNLCGATVCGSGNCVFATVVGYPVGCHIHPAQSN